MTKRKRKHKNMREAEFSKIKILLNAGVPINMAEKIAQRSWIVIANVKKAENFDEYRNLVRKYNEIHVSPSPTASFSPSPTPSPTNDEKEGGMTWEEHTTLRLMDIQSSLDKIKRRLLIG